MEKKHRLEWIDFAKGIGILLTIVGHSLAGAFTAGIVRGMIFSFHMPLFFILSCATFRCSADAKEFKLKSLRAAKHLLIPALGIYLFRIVYSLFTSPSQISNIQFWIRNLYKLVYASGVGVNLGFCDAPAIGIPWFFFALFAGRTLFDYLHLKITHKDKLVIIVCILSMIGVLFGNSQWLPFSFDIALACMPLFWFGNQMQKMDFSKNPWRKLFTFGVIWLISFYLQFPNITIPSYFELAYRRYPIYPICFITAITGTIAVCEFSIIACKIKKLSLPIIVIGKNSLYLLCIHALDSIWRDFWFNDKQLIASVKRVLCDLLIFCFVLIIKKIIVEIVRRKRQAGLEA